MHDTTHNHTPGAPHKQQHVHDCIVLCCAGAVCQLPTPDRVAQIPNPAFPWDEHATHTLWSVLPAAAAATERRQASLNIQWLQQEKRTKAPPTNRHHAKHSCRALQPCCMAHRRHACNMTSKWSADAAVDESGRRQPSSIHTHTHVYGNTGPQPCAVPLSSTRNTHKYTQGHMHIFSYATGC